MTWNYGTGSKYEQEIDCPECDGEGYVPAPEFGSRYVCRRCDGEGFLIVDNSPDPDRRYDEARERTLRE